MIDMRHEEIIPLSAAAKLLPTRPHIASVYRWAKTGVNGVKLETIKVGAKIFTSREALQRFVNRCSGETAVQRPEDHRHRIDRARKALADMGV